MSVLAAIPVMRLGCLVIAGLLLTHPVPGQPNPPTATPERGFFKEPVRVELSAQADDEIRYTTDGTAPGPQSGNIYSEPLQLSKATVLRFLAHRNGEVSETQTHSYLLLDAIRKQDASQDGYPNDAYWGDYAMDPRVTLDVLYEPLMDEALLQTGSLSIVTHPDSLFHPERGIYANPEEEGREWEREVSVEWFEPGGESGFQVGAGLRIHGGTGRKPEKTPKKNFRITFRDEYGPKKLDYPIFGPDAAERHNTLVLRGPMNNAWTYGGAFNTESQQRYAQYMRDAFASDLLLAAGQVSPHNRSTHVYLNGIYWGMYTLQERPDAEFMEEYFAGDDGEFDVLNSGDAISGNETAWERLMDLSELGFIDDEQYAVIESWLDIDNFIDYMAVNQFGGNADWDEKNWYSARRQKRDRRFRLFSWDAEKVVQRPDENRVARFRDRRPTGLLKALMTNATFKRRFADRVACLTAPDGPLTAENAANLWMQRASTFDRAVIAESARWGDFQREEPYTYAVEYLEEQERIMEDYFPVRTSTWLSQLREEGYYPALDPPILSQNGGSIPSEFELTIEGEGIWYTLDGTDPAGPDGQPSESSFAFDGPVSLSGTKTVIARVREGSEWSAACPATFFAPQDLRDLVINEIHYHPADQGDRDGDDFEFVEIHHSGDEAMDLTGVELAGGIHYAFPSGTTIPPKSYVTIARSTGGFLAQFAFRPFGEYEMRLDNAGDTIELLHVASGIIDRVTYDDEAPWPTAADGTGSSLQLVDPNVDNSDAKNWVASSVSGGSGSTPGQRNFVFTDSEAVPERVDDLVAVYPNPFDDMVHFEIESGHLAERQLSVFDVLGRLVFSSALPRGTRRVTWRPDVAAPGIYFYRLTDSASKRTLASDRIIRAR